MTTPFLTHPSFQFERMRYGFYTRKGGVSSNSFGSLNCGIASGDLLDNVHENQRRVASGIGVEAASLVFCKQIHSDKVIPVETPWEKSRRPEGDALITRTPGIGLAVMSADCVPVLFYESTQHIAAAAHSGWKGAIGGVLDQTINNIVAMGGKLDHIHACIGPCIRQASYEVGPEFFEQFVKHDAANDAFFIPSQSKNFHRFDLAGYAHKRLKQAGVEHISDIARDTLSEEADFFSYRRAVLRDDPQNGVQMSAITLM